MFKYSGKQKNYDSEINSYLLGIYSCRSSSPLPVSLCPPCMNVYIGMYTYTGMHTHRIHVILLYRVRHSEPFFMPLSNPPLCDIWVAVCLWEGSALVIPLWSLRVLVFVAERSLQWPFLQTHFCALVPPIGSAPGMGRSVGGVGSLPGTWWMCSVSGKGASLLHCASRQPS